MSLSDDIRRIVNVAFISYDWGSFVTEDITPEADMIDVYVERFTPEVLRGIMSSIDEEIASIGGSFNLTDAERAAVRKQPFPAVEEKCRRIIVDVMAKQTRERMDRELLDENEAQVAWMDRSLEDYLETESMTPADVVMVGEGN